MAGYIPIPPEGWTPTATRTDTKLFPDDTMAALNATYVSFQNFDGSPVVGKHVIIKLTADGTGIEDITVEVI